MISFVIGAAIIWGALMAGDIAAARWNLTPSQMMRIGWLGGMVFGVGLFLSGGAP